MPLTEAQHALIKSKIYLLIQGGEDMSFLKSSDFKNLASLVSSSLTIAAIEMLTLYVRKIKNQISNMTIEKAQEIKNQILVPYREKCSPQQIDQLDTLANELISWLCVTKEKMDLFQHLNADFTTQEVEQYVRTVIDECLDTQVIPAVSHFTAEGTQKAHELQHKISELEDTLSKVDWSFDIEESDIEKSLGQFQFQLPTKDDPLQALYDQAIALKLQAEPKYITQPLYIFSLKDLEGLPVVNNELAHLIDEFRKLNLDLTNKKNRKKLDDVYRKITKYCTNPENLEKAKTNEEYLYYLCVNLEYTIRYYNLLAISHPKHKRSAQGKDIENAVHRIAYLNTQVKFNPPPIYDITPDKLMDPMVSKYLCPFLSSPDAFITSVTLCDGQQVSGTSHSDPTLFPRALFIIKDAIKNKKDIQKSVIDYLFKVLDQRDKQFSVIKSIAEEDIDAYFTYLRESPIWGRLELSAESEHYRIGGPAERNIICQIVNIKNKLYEYEKSKAATNDKHKKNMIDDKFYGSLLTIFHQLTDDLYDIGKMEHPNINKAYIEFIRSQIVKACRYYRIKAEVAFDRNEPSENLFGLAKKCINIATIWPENKPNETETLLQELQKLEEKMTTQKEQERIHTLALQKEVNIDNKQRRQAQKTAHQHKHDHSTSSNSSRNENQSDLNLSKHQELPKAKRLSDEEISLNKAGKLLRERKFDLAEKKLTKIKNTVTSPEGKNQLLLDFIELYLQKALQLRRRIHLFSHFDSPRATPVLQEENALVNEVKVCFAKAKQYQDELKKSLTQKALDASEMVSHDLDRESIKFDSYLFNFYQYCEYRKAIIKSSGLWGKGDSGFSQSVTPLCENIQQSIQDKSNSARSHHVDTGAFDFRPLIDSELQLAIHSFTARGYAVILHGGYIRDKLRGIGPNDVDLILLGEGDPEALLRQIFKEGTVKKNLYRPNQYEVFCSGRKFDVTFKSAIHLDKVQEELYQESDSDSNSMSLLIDQDGYHPLYDPSGNGLNDAQNGIIHTDDFDTKINEDPFRLLRYIRMVTNRKCDMFPYLLLLDETKKTFYSQKLLERCHLKNEFTRFESELGKLFLHGKAEQSFQMLVTYGIIQTFYPTLFERLKNRTFEKFFMSKLEEMDSRHRHHEVNSFKDLFNFLQRFVPANTPASLSPYIQNNMFQPQPMTTTLTPTPTSDHSSRQVRVK